MYDGSPEWRIHRTFCFLPLRMALSEEVSYINIFPIPKFVHSLLLNTQRLLGLFGLGTLEHHCVYF